MNGVNVLFKHVPSPLSPLLFNIICLTTVDHPHGISSRHQNLGHLVLQLSGHISNTSETLAKMSSETAPQNPAFQELTADNRGPVVIVASYIFLVITVIVVLTRLITRFKVSRRLVIDDGLALASTVFLIAQTIAITVAVNAGLGRHRNALSDNTFDKYAKVCSSIPSTTLLTDHVHRPSTYLAC